MKFSFFTCLKFSVVVLLAGMFFMSVVGASYVYAAAQTRPDIPDTTDGREPTSPITCEKNAQKNYFEIEVVKKSQAQERDTRGNIKTGSFKETSERAVFTEVSEEDIKNVLPERARALPKIGTDKVFVVRAVGGAKKNEPCTPMQTLAVHLKEVAAVHKGKLIIDPSGVVIPQPNFSQESTFEESGGFTREGGEKLGDTTIFQGETEGLIPHLNQKALPGLYRITYSVVATGKGSDNVETENRTFGVYFTVGFKPPKTKSTDPDKELSEKIDEVISELQNSRVEGVYVQQLMERFGFIPETSAVTSCPADINRDGQVDIADLVQVARLFGNTVVPGAKEDLNQDGKVDIVDLVFVARQFGNTCPRGISVLPPIPVSLSQPPLFAQFFLSVRRVFWVLGN